MLAGMGANEGQHTPAAPASADVEPVPDDADDAPASDAFADTLEPGDTENVGNAGTASSYVEPSGYLGDSRKTLETSSELEGRVDRLEARLDALEQGPVPAVEQGPVTTASDVTEGQ